MAKEIVIRGARQHNLKNISLVLPRNKFIVVTGLSGSGKSSLAFDTLYAEGQRRYVESLSAYARQFLGQMNKPDVDAIDGLSPAISIQQKTVSKNPRSTVGTVTEIYDYLRLLYARIGKPHCPDCGKLISKQTPDRIADTILSTHAGKQVFVCAPVAREKKGEFANVFSEYAKQGYTLAIVDGKQRDLSEKIVLNKKLRHDVSIVIDWLDALPQNRSRLVEAVESALDIAKGKIEVVSEDKREIFSRDFACADCGTSFEELSPRLFSFNNPFGACPVCGGLGTKMEIDPDLIIPDKSKSFSEGALVTWAGAMSYGMIQSVSDHYGFSLEVPVKKMRKRDLEKILYGAGDEKIPFAFYRSDGSGSWTGKMFFEGIINSIERRYLETKSENARAYYQKFMSSQKCPECGGKRLKKLVLGVTVGGKNIAEASDMSVEAAKKFFKNLSLSDRDKEIAKMVLREINARLDFLKNVGLSYLTLSRSASTLSGGESQRIHLATQIGSGLTGVLYILDEPSIGLHQRDNKRLIETLKRLRDLGNTLVVVEHDEATILSSDWVVDLGPGAGIHGGKIVSQGTPRQIIKDKKSLTGDFLAGRRRIPVRSEARKGNGNKIVVKGCREHNLKNIDVEIPLGKLVCVTGVSGSGKSTLVDDILHKSLARIIYKAGEKPGEHDGIVNVENIDKVLIVDQSPIGRTPRSNPATYTGAFGPIRELFSKTREARMRAYKPGRFSFNVAGGRCDACDGDGIIKIEMHFLPDVYVPCEECKGKRYNRETLEVEYKGKNISEVLEMTVEEALRFFENIPQIRSKLQTLNDVGLGYIKLGQPATTLSGGEAQRVKLSTYLSKRGTGKTLYILDEPTTGLHFADVEKLLNVLNRLVDANNTVLVIEHNLDVIRSSDHVIDLGPEGGDAGGKIVAQGTPEEVAKNNSSHTGRFLKQYFEKK